VTIGNYAASIITFSPVLFNPHRFGSNVLHAALYYVSLKCLKIHLNIVKARTKGTEIE
jgi:hypothetical protein